jgi:pimeloyl-ACP methyl ester carboxylesterase
MSERRTTYVLVHGGGSTARFWDRLLPLLDAPAVAVDLPGRGAHPAPLGSITVDDEVASVVGDIRREVPEGPVVLVAHSSGGLVVPGVAAALGTRLVHVVLNAALVPPEGGCGLDCMQARHRDGLVAALDQAAAAGTEITLPGPPADPESFRNSYGGDPLDDETLMFVVDPVRCVADTVHHYLQPVNWSMAGSVPVTYMVNERDRPIPATMQLEMITRLPRPPAVERLDCGHLAPVTDPELVAYVLASAASAAESERRAWATPIASSTTERSATAAEPGSLDSVR